MEFVVIDLASQKEAFKKYVEDWTPKEVIAYLKQFGIVTRPSLDRQTYYFVSIFWLATMFEFDRFGKLHIHRMHW
ncbi:MAG: hypothetical protein K8L91_00300 [Anaerolineae bacterium]|nr:hypothetical protein [Anaerolineae bacterium]